MWSLLGFCLLGTLISASTAPAWKDNKEYLYRVSGRTLASLEIANEFSGILMRATLKIQTRPDGNLQCLLMNTQYAQIHSELSDGPLTDIPSAEVSWKALEMSRKPFQIVIKRGVIVDLIMSKRTSNWEANIIKGIVSQFQMNLNQGHGHDSPNDERHDSALFKVMEETVSGYTQTLYEINPLPEHLLLNSEIIPDFQKVKGDDDEVLEVIKHKNYTDNIELPSFVYGLGEVNGDNAGTNVMGNFFVRSTMTKALVTGSLKQFTIQNSFTLNEISVNPTLRDKQKGFVVSMWNATLDKVKSNYQILEDVSEPVALGGLVYSYNKPFSHLNEVSKKQKDQDYSQYDTPAWQILNKPFYSESLSDDSAVEEGYQQDKPQLNSAPESPLMPYTVGNKGRSVKFNIDIVKTVVSMSREIGKDLEDPNQTLQESSLSKFINLIRLIRLMNEEELRRAGNELFSNSDDSSKSPASAVYRDAVAESGNPATILLIQSWIETKAIKNQEAAHVFATMTDSIQVPTTEVIKVLFELAKKPVVLSQTPLNETAILSVAKLIRQVYYQESHFETQYPMKSFKNLREKQGLRFVRKTVIPYLKDRLDQAIYRNEPIKVHTYIRALGSIGDPEILKAFEPYLEGKKQCSQFQRGLMVISMDKLVKTNPEVVRDILFRIFQNSGEYQIIRVAAVYQLMRAKPTVEMLQLMAANTKIDSQEQVNAAVKTSILSAAELTCEEYKEVSYAAKMAKPLLTEKEYGLQQGGNYLKTYLAEQLDLTYKETLQYYGSSDSFLPKGVKYALRSNRGGSKDQILNIQFLKTSIEQFVHVLEQQTKTFQEQTERQQQKSSDQLQNPLSSISIARILDMKAEAREQFEGTMLLMNAVSPYKILSSDNNTLEQLAESVESWEKSLNNKEINYVKIINSDDKIVACPTEMGIPLVFSYDEPIFIRLKGLLKASAWPKISENGKLQKPEKIQVNSDMTVTVGSKVQGHVSFFTPFDNQQYYAGFEKAAQVHLPVVGTMEMNLKSNELKLNVQPQERYSKAPMFHYSSWPFTSRRNILDFKTLMAQHHNQYIISDNIRRIDTVVGKKQTGLAYHIEMEYNRDTNKMSDLLSEQSMLIGLQNLWNYGDIQYTHVNITHLPKESTTNKIEISFKYQQSYSQNVQEEALRWEEVSRSSKDSFSGPMLSKAVSSGIKNVDAHAVDAQIRFRGQKSNDYILALAYARSSVDPKSRLAAFIKQDLQGDKPFEMKLELANEIPNTNALNPADALAATPKLKSALKVNLDYKNGEKGEVKADLNMARSEDRKEYLKSQPAYHQCKYDMRKGNLQSPACVNITIEAQSLDKFDLDIKYDNLDSAVEDVIETVYSHLRYEYYPNLEVDHEKSQAKNQIKLRGQADQDFRYVNVTVGTHKDQTTFEDIELNEDVRRLIAVHPTLQLPSRLWSRYTAIDTINPICVVDKTQVTTFSNWTYDASISDSWTVVTQLVPRRANEKQQSIDVEKQLKSELRNLVVLARDSTKTHEGKDFKVVISSPETDFEIVEITLTPNQENSKTKADVTVNKKQIKVRQSESTDIRDGYIKIYALPNEEVKVEINKVLDLMYDGERVRLEATSSLLRGAVRGLCGQFNDQQNEDTLTPQNCFARDTEKFIRSFEVETREGKQIRNELSRNSEECVEKSMPLYVNVIRDVDFQVDDESDESSGNKCTRLQTKYIEKDSEICFTLTQVPVCSSHCHAQGYITKHIPVHCIAKSNVAQTWKKQIDNGSSPDFSHKPEHKQIQWEVPRSCSE